LHARQVERDRTRLYATLDVAAFSDQVAACGFASSRPFARVFREAFVFRPSNGTGCGGNTNGEIS
jgi:hypothetical protein